MSENFSVEEVAQAIIEARKRLGVSQRELAKRIGISPPTMNRIEKGGGNIEAKTLLRIAEALDIPPPLLLGKYSDEFIEMWEMFKELPEDRKQKVIDHARDQAELSRMSK